MRSEKAREKADICEIEIKAEIEKERDAREIMSDETYLKPSSGRARLRSLL